MLPLCRGSGINENIFRHNHQAFARQIDVLRAGVAPLGKIVIGLASLSVELSLLGVIESKIQVLEYDLIAKAMTLSSETFNKEK